jgi:hypothetical protein
MLHPSSPWQNPIDCERKKERKYAVPARIHKPMWLRQAPSQIGYGSKDNEEGIGMFVNGGGGGFAGCPGFGSDSYAEG